MERLISTMELRALLGISRAKEIKLRKINGLPFYKVGRQIKYRVSEVEAWIQEQKQ